MGFPKGRSGSSPLWSNTRIKTRVRYNLIAIRVVHSLLKRLSPGTGYSYAETWIVGWLPKETTMKLTVDGLGPPLDHNLTSTVYLGYGFQAECLGKFRTESTMAADSQYDVIIRGHGG